MADLLKYVQGRPLDEVAAALKLESVMVKCEGTLVKFCYQHRGRSIAWEKPHIQDCRGTILRLENGTEWSIVAHCFKKFHSYRSSFVNLDFTPEQKLELREKVDGTLLQVWFDHHANRWRVSTLRAITTGQARGLLGSYPDAPTFDELFWRLINQEKFIPNANRKTTFLFELCTKFNPVITHYDDSRLAWLASLGETSSPPPGIELAARPSRIPVASMEEALTHVNQCLWGRNQPEGFVLWVDGVPRAKLKHQRYEQYAARLTTVAMKHSAPRAYWASVLGTVIFKHDRLSCVPSSHYERCSNLIDEIERDVRATLEEARASSNPRRVIATTTRRAVGQITFQGYVSFIESKLTKDTITRDDIIGYLVNREEHWFTRVSRDRLKTWF
jgi:hypothetical protein